MRKLLSLFFFLCCYSSIAQNYQCLQPGVKRYFINANGYLRGVRIDSVTTMGDTTVYHLFHTPRGDYDYWGAPHPFDSTRGSWVGKDVIQLMDGTFIFDNYENMPITVKTQAGIGDSWIFQLNIDSTQYYRATVISIDTTHILGDLDTVKRIIINKFIGPVFMPSDTLNGYEILLSKNHGFATVFDLYTFPYDSTDYFHNNCGGQSFDLFSFHSPTDKELYDWHAGDVYQYAKYTDAWTLSTLAIQYTLDTILSRTDFASYNSFDYRDLVSNINIVSDYPLVYYYTSSAASRTLTYNSDLFIDTVKMPEEFLQQYLYYYYPDDTSYCIKSPLYKAMTSSIVGVNYITGEFGSGPYISKKMHLGLVDYIAHGWVDPGYHSTSEIRLIFCISNGTNCGTYFPVDVPEVEKLNTITLFPNPTTTELHIQAPSNVTTITITNSIGQQIYSTLYNSKEVTVSVAQYPPGLYFVRINNEVIQKFIKE